MAARKELIQRINVSAEMKVKGNDVAGSLGFVMDSVRRRVQRELPHCVEKTAKGIANHAKEDQVSSLRQLHATGCGRLMGSISTLEHPSAGLSTRAEVGTNINEKYPLYLVHGRGAVVAKKAKALKISRKCGRKKPFFRRSVGSSRPKDYMRLADRYTQAAIPGIVERECSELGKI